MHVRYLMSLAVFSLLLSSCSGNHPLLHKSTRVMMGTLVEITLAGKDDLAKTTAKLSSTKSNASTISRLFTSRQHSRR